MTTVRLNISRMAWGFACAAIAVACRPEEPTFESVNGDVQIVDYKGRRALHLVAPPDKRSTDVDVLAIARGSDFRDGAIQVDVAGSPFDGIPGARGFIGLAFHVSTDGSRFECFYLRPTNGRAEDQLRRNHATQYIAHPDFPWQTLREASPGLYESYADIEPGVWTRLKIVVKGTTGRLFVGQADQPALIVNDLKLGEIGGRVALWSHPSTDAYFSRLEIGAPSP
jgi:hypothetical protein